MKKLSVTYFSGFVLILFMSLISVKIVCASDITVKLFSGTANESCVDIKQLTDAANKGDAEAQYWLAVSLENRDANPDYEQVIYWLQKAAEQGHDAAQYHLGLAYAYGNGYGVPQSHEQAISWYRKAANQGNNKAQLQLGNNYVLGWGVPKNNKLAFMWYAICLDQTTDTLLIEHLKIYLENVKQYMTAEEIAEAKRMAVEWRENFKAAKKRLNGDQHKHE